MKIYTYVNHLSLHQAVQIRIFEAFAHLFLLLQYIVKMLPVIILGLRNNWYQSYNNRNRCTKVPKWPYCLAQPRAKNQRRCRRPESVGQSNIVETLASFQVLPQFYKRNECPKLLSFHIAILNPEYQVIFTISQWWVYSIMTVYPHQFCHWTFHCN